MPRTKTKREFSFKPRFKHFIPKEGGGEAIRLLHEEIEALRLMDYQGLYQEDAAQSMGVSRPTFSRIVRNARMKVATALINGKELIIEDERKDFRVAFICDDSENFGALSLEAPFIVVAHLEGEQILGIKTIENPVHISSIRPGSVLPKVLYEENVNYLITDKAGEGLKNSLLNRGIFLIKKESLRKEELAKLHQIL